MTVIISRLLKILFCERVVFLSDSFHNINLYILFSDITNMLITLLTPYWPVKNMAEPLAILANKKFAIYANIACRC